MKKTDPPATQLHDIAALAANYVNTTGRHIFLTGKAGTGKTTFLKYISEHTYKNTAVAAPTGIAAINAGGVTLHSLLQLPFGAFIPDNIAPGAADSRINTPQTLFKDLRFNATKRALIQALELLIIDEVSMLRADLLDCIDHVLRFLRRRVEPFGGLQILFIGDLLQLPPVINDAEMALLLPYYDSPYFFEAHSLRENPPILIELQKIFRQRDQHFIDLLNRLRHNQQTHQDIQKLNSYHQPSFDRAADSGYIHITTHNQRADRINHSRLQSLPAPAYHYPAQIQGNFPENLFPVSETLELKAGAQVMFIKNDPSGEGQFFNGKIGIVEHLDNEGIRVACGEDDVIQVDTHLWENKQYVLNKTNNDVEEKNLGSFEQYPLKLAWAITVHKSQGLTFEKAILDLSGTFAAGQLYVALSRLTSLAGLVLSSPLPENPPRIDPSLQTFADGFQDTAVLQQNLDHERRDALRQLARRAFQFDGLLTALNAHQQSFNKDENRSLKQQHLPWTQALIDDVLPLKTIGEKFIRQVDKILEQEHYLALLAERLARAQDYFDKAFVDFLARLRTHIQTVKRESKVKTYLKELDALRGLFFDQNKFILKIAVLARCTVENKIPEKKDFQDSALYQSAEKKRTKKTDKKDKTPTKTISYDLFREGKSVAEIAQIRGLVASTIEGHLAAYVATGELDVLTLLSEDKLAKIAAEYQGKEKSFGQIKAILGDEISYGEIRLAVVHLQRENPGEALVD